jgi:hypothetical protein
MPPEQSISDFLNGETPEQQQQQQKKKKKKEKKPPTDGDELLPSGKAKSPRPDPLPLQTQYHLLAVTLEASTCRLALFTQLRFAILASLPPCPNNGTPKAFVPFVHSCSIFLFLPPHNPYAADGTADANADAIVRRALRTGGLVSRSGGHSLPLSWLAQRPAAFTDEPYTLLLQLPVHLHRQRHVLVTLVGAAEEAARRLGTTHRFPLHCVHREECSHQP